MSDFTPVIDHSGRRVLAGVTSEPLYSSLGKGWRGIALEFFIRAAADFTGVFENHGITVHLDGCVDLHQQFDGKVAHTQMRRGNISIAPACAPKKFQHKVGGDFVVVHVSPTLLSQVAEDLKRTKPGNVEVLNNFCTRDAQLQRLVQQLCNEYRAADLASAICAEALGRQLAIHLIRRYSTAGTVAPLPSSKLSPRTLKRAIDYIDSHLSNDLTVDEIARALSLSAGHFAQAFKKTMGVAPHRYVLGRRMDSAKVLLRESDLPIANLAALVGFSTHSHFCATFKRLVGDSPRGFRCRE